MFSIAKEALPLIAHYELLPTGSNGELDLYAVIITDFRFISSDCISITMRHDGYYSSNNKEITFEIKNIFGVIELRDIFVSHHLALKSRDILTHYKFGWHL